MARRATSTLPGERRASSSLLRFHISHVLQVCSRHTADHDAGVPARGPQRRGLPRPRLLGRALRLSVPELPPAGDHPRAADVPLPAPGRGARGGARGRLRGRDVPVAERQRRHRGDPGRPPQPALGPVGPRPQPQPAPRQRGDLLQHLALLPGHRRPRLPARLRRRDDARDRALLGLDRPLQPRARPLRDPRRDGPGRVPREVPRRRRGRPAQQRLHQRHGGVDLPSTAQRVLGLLPEQPARRAARPARARPTTRSPRGRR